MRVRNAPGLRPLVTRAAIAVILLTGPYLSAQDRATVGIAPFEGEGGASIGAVVETVTGTLETVLSMTGRFDPQSIGSIGSDQTDELRAASDRNGVDNVVAGAVTSDGEGRIRITLSVYNRAEDAVTVRVRQEAPTLFSVFDAVDRAVIALIEGLTDAPVRFGAIGIQGDWRTEGDRLLLDGREYAAAGRRIPNVLAREYDLTILRDGVGEIFAGRVSVVPEETVTVTVPLLEITTASIDLRRGALPVEQRLDAGAPGSGENGTTGDALRFDLQRTAPPPVDAPVTGNAITLGHDLSGRTLPVYGFNDAFFRVARSFTEETGIEVIPIPNEEQEWRFDITMTREEPPEVIRLSQPGPVFDLIRLELVEDARRTIDADLLESRIPRRFLSLTERDGVSAGIPVLMSLKSLYWYAPARFEAEGLTPPTTPEEFTALTEALQERGITPFGFGIESGEAATGWPFTDWIEDRILQRYPVETYDAWTGGDLGFRGTPVEEEITELTSLLRDETRTHGGNSFVAETPFHRSVGLLLTDPPRAGIVFAASFNASWYQDRLDQLAVFPTPPVRAGEERVLVGGEIISIPTATPEARTFLRYLTRDDVARFLLESAERGNVLTHRTAEPGWYRPFEREIAGIIDEADIVRYDGSDLMTRQVGMERFLTAGRSLMLGSAIRGVLLDIEEVRRSTR
ncbi:MAG: ABC transporter substrate-binding protein [Alkalispirochaeta sp.]